MFPMDIGPPAVNLTKQELAHAATVRGHLLAQDQVYQGWEDVLNLNQLRNSMVVGGNQMARIIDKGRNLDATLIRITFAEEVMLP